MGFVGRLPGTDQNTQHPPEQGRLLPTVGRQNSRGRQMPPSHVSGGGLETEDKMNDGVMNLKQQIVGLQNDYDLPVVCVLFSTI